MESEAKFEKTDPKRFHYTAPTSMNKENFERLTKMWQDVVDLIDEVCPVSLEKSSAISYLDITRFWANAAIVRRS